MRALGRFRADRDAHHPAAVEDRGREVRGARSVDALRPRERVAIERLAVQPVRLVAETTPGRLLTGRIIGATDDALLAEVA